MAPDRVVTSNWRLAVEKILQRGRPLLRVRLQTTSPWTSRRRDAEAKLSHEKFLSNFGTRKKNSFESESRKLMLQSISNFLIKISFRFLLKCK